MPTLPHLATAYARQSRWSDPGPHAARLDALPANPALLPAALNGLLLHPVSAASSGTPIPDAAQADKQVRRVEDLITLLLGRDGAPLDQRRAEGQRAFVTCRHFALFAASVLRRNGIPARLRVGFASYFTPGFHEDHWVCEHHDGTTDGWKLLDAELDPPGLERFRVAFDPADVPRGTAFVPASAMWQMVRHGSIDAEVVGVSAIGVRGAWFVAASLLRDLAALAVDEMLPWDYWGAARTFGPQTGVPLEWTDRLDQLAEALTAEPQTLEEAKALLRAFPWAAPTPRVLSYPDGMPVEVSVV